MEKIQAVRRHLRIAIIVAATGLFGVSTPAKADIYHFQIAGTLYLGDDYGTYTTPVFKGLDLTEPTVVNVEFLLDSSYGGSTPTSYYPDPYGSAIWTLSNSSGTRLYESRGAGVFLYNSTVNSQQSIRFFSQSGPIMEIDLWYNASIPNSSPGTYANVINTHQWLADGIGNGETLAQSSIITGESDTAYEYFTARVSSVAAFVTPVPEPTSGTFAFGTLTVSCLFWKRMRRS